MNACLTVALTHRLRDFGVVIQQYLEWFDQLEAGGQWQSGHVADDQLSGLNLQCVLGGLKPSTQYT